MTTTDEAREALYNTAGYPMTPAEYRRRLDAFEAAVRADQLAVCGEWHREAEQELAALREALEDIALLYTDNRTRPATFAIRAGEIAVAALAATPAEDEDLPEYADDEYNGRIPQ